MTLLLAILFKSEHNMYNAQHISILLLILYGYHTRYFIKILINTDISEKYEKKKKRICERILKYVLLEIL